MSGMDAAPRANLGGLGWFSVSWLTMTAAMMLAAVGPAGRLALVSRSASIFVASEFLVECRGAVFGYRA